MADAKRESTVTTLPLPVSTTSGTSTNPLYNKSLFAPLPTSPARPQLTSIAHAGLNLPIKPLQYKNNMSSKFQAPPLTGVAAMEENRLYEKELLEKQRTLSGVNHEKEVENRTLPGVSPNPARVAVMGIMSQPMSKPTDAPSMNLRPPPVVITTETPPSNEMVRDLSAMTVASPIEMTTTTSIEQRPMSNTTPNPRKRPASPRLVDDRANKAMTFPPLQTTNVEQLSPRTARRDMTFPSQSSSSHQSTKKHKCPHCLTEFTRHHNLKSHLLTHSQEKPYGCQQCTSRFRRLHDLKRHIKLHTGEKSHACLKCGRKFARGDALARHNRGPGGCAGRRGSNGEIGDDYIDDEEEEGGEISMEGVQYHGNEREQQFEEDDNDNNNNNNNNNSRRRSEPDRARSDTMNSTTSTTSGNYHLHHHHQQQQHHSSTFPGLAPISSKGLLPPTTMTTTTMTTSPKHLSPKPPFSTIHYSSPGNIMDSPKPLSPGQMDQQNRMGNTRTLPNRNHGDQQIRFLPPPTSTSQTSTTLPSLSADPRFLREPIIIDNGRTSSENVWDIVHSLQKRLNDATEQIKQQDERHEMETLKLNDEIKMLRAQLEK